MKLPPSIKKLIVPAGALLAAGFSTQSLKLGPWGWLFGIAVALALWLRPERSGQENELPLLMLEARLPLGGKTHLSLVAVEGERFLVAHSDRGIHLEKVESVAHTCVGGAAPRSHIQSPVASLRDRWAQ